MATEAKQAYKAYMQAKADRIKYQELHSKATMKTMATQAEQASSISKAFGDQQNSLSGLYKRPLHELQLCSLIQKSIF